MSFRKSFVSLLLAALPAAAAPITVTDGLVLHYSFDTDAADQSGNGHDGTVVGATHLATGGHGGTGAYSFDGADDHIFADGLNEVNTAAGGLNTVAFWMYWERDNTSMPFSWGSDNGYNDLWLVTGYPYGGMNGFGFNSGNGDIYGVSNDDLDSRWVHVTAVFQNGYNASNGNVLYIDGVRQNLSQQAWGGGSNRGADSYIQLSGWDAGSGYEFPGRLDELFVYNRGLTDEEVLSIYHAETTAQAVPEPSTMALFGLGAALAGIAVRRRRNAAK